MGIVGLDTLADDWILEHFADLLIGLCPWVLSLGRVRLLRLNAVKFRLWRLRRLLRRLWPALLGGQLIQREFKIVLGKLFPCGPLLGAS